MSDDLDVLRIRFPLLTDAISKDGGLYNLGWYIGWSCGQKEAMLDGTFSADQLRQIADYMDAQSLPTPPTGE